MYINFFNLSSELEISFILELEIKKDAEESSFNYCDEVTLNDITELLPGLTLGLIDIMYILILNANRSYN